MKKTFRATVLLLVLLLLVTMFAAAAGQKDGDQKVVIKYNDSDVPGGMRTTFVNEVFLPGIVEETGGRVEIQDFWGGSLLGPPETLVGINDGITDVGFMFAEFFFMIHF